MQSDQLCSICADMTSATSLSLSLYNLLLYARIIKAERFGDDWSMPEELEAPGSPLVARDRCLRLQVKLSSSLYRVQAAHLQKKFLKEFVL